MIFYHKALFLYFSIFFSFICFGVYLFIWLLVHCYFIMQLLLISLIKFCFQMLFFSSKIYNCYIQSFYVSPKVPYLLILTSFPVNFLAYFIIIILMFLSINFNICIIHWSPSVDYIFSCVIGHIFQLPCLSNNLFQIWQYVFIVEDAP